MNYPRKQALQLGFDDLMAMRDNASPRMDLCSMGEDCDCINCVEAGDREQLTLGNLAAVCVCWAFTCMLIIEICRWCLAHVAAR